MPHGMCLLWRKDLLLLHVLTDSVITLSYYSIPVALIYFVMKRKDLTFRWMFILFGIFILACGTTHLLNIWTIWHPDYVLEGLVKLLTAFVSIATAVLLWPLIPHALKLPSPDVLARANLLLQQEIQERKHNANQVSLLNAELERRVEERTQAWREANLQLTQEIQERKQAEISLRLSETKYRNLHESMREAFVMVDMTGRIQEFNKAFENMLGYSEQDLLTLRYQDVTPEKWLAVEERILKDQILVRGYSDVYEKEYRRSNGEIFPVELRTFLLQDGTRKPVSMWAIVRDITDRRRAELALRESEARLKVIVETAADGIITIDEQGTIESVNTAIEQIFGYSKAEVVGRNVALLMPEPDRSQHDGYLARYLKTGERKVIGARREALGLRKDGSEFPIDLAVAEIQLDDRRFFTAIIRDNTQRKQTELQLIEQTRQLREADRRKDEFLAMLGHELRNPLTPISNVAQLMCSQSLDEPTLTWAREVLGRNVAHISRLVDDLLDVSRISHGLVTLKKERVEISMLLNESSDAIHGLTQTKHQTLHCDLPQQPVYLEGDSVRLVQIFTNLLNNAAKYTGEGGRIDLAVDVEGPSVSIHVRDNGMGIAPELLPHVFDLFAQSDRGLDRSEGGLGIGLTLVKKLVELHGGHVSAHSRGINQGAEFIVRLPRLLETSTQTESLNPRGSTLETPQGLRILLIDDNRDVVESIALLLEVLGHQVEIARDGLQGLSAAQSFAPDVIVLDIGLPGIDGFEVARRLREQPSFRNVLLIALSGYAKNPNDPRAASAGFDHYLMKPPDLTVLRTLIADYQRSGRIEKGA